ncbi:hypothetical protein FXF51_46595 [Nonomuraea sp. PA05]|uniref:hypothetical protein n=1 Tax=Nonomuraea sp. PA05 TaxID=2604466 RepID=UPI0011D8B3A5|nr:hypothetical protein [Nonomuraea sp. PA05]TYB54722.1 hypothetical protein FXF51_46595 [Nonomuraea sp. PA05]
MNNQLDVKLWADRYVAQWNESDPDRRSALIRTLWAADGTQVLVNPPQEIHDAAVALAFPVPPLEARGHDALNARVARAYETFVLLPNVLGVRWSMVSTSTGQAVGGGLDILALDGDGRLRTDHQFIGVS